jgi:multidrug efflux system membrane fusion protein
MAGKSGGGRGGPRGMGAMPVAVASAARQALDVTRNALGNVVSTATVSVQAQVSGQLLQVAYTEGQLVHKGDLLAQIDARPYEATLAQARGQLAKDRAILEQARMDELRYDDLLQKKSISRQQAEDQKWLVKQQEAALQVDQAQVDAAQLNVSFCHVVSPIEGRVGLRLVDPGNLVQANASTALAVITRMHPMTVVFALPEDDLPVVMARLRRGAHLVAEAWDRSGDHLLDTGTVLAVDSQINTGTGTVNLKAQFSNASDRLFPNQFVNVVLHVDRVDDAIVVPAAAVLRGAKGAFAYVVKDDNSVAMTPVQTGPSQGALVSIRSGLNVGDRVVVDGADKLRDGAHVTVPDDHPAPSATPVASPSGTPAGESSAKGAADDRERHHHHGHKPDGATP